MAKLALDGGTPVRTRPLPPWPHFEDADVDAAAQVLRSGRVNYWTGEHGRRFEEEFATLCQADHAVALSNGTVALELALEALGVGPGHEVIVPCRTFVASASAVVRVGARPVMADIDRDSQVLTAQTVAAAITDKTRAVIAVHLAGWPCDVPALRAVLPEHVAIVEDCAQAHGAALRGHSVGSMGEIGAFSFCQDKIITTAGEGGMVTTNNTQLYERMWELKDHGRGYGAVHREEHPPGFRWLTRRFGTNGRMTEIQAAIGRLALHRLPDWRATRQARAAQLLDAGDALAGLRAPRPPADVEHAYYKLYLFVEPGELRSGWTRDRVLEALGAEGIPAYQGICPEIYREAAFTDGLAPPTRLPVARELGETSMMFPVHPTLTAADGADFVAALTKVMAQAAEGS